MALAANPTPASGLDIWGHSGRPAGGGGSVEWYTPIDYIIRARSVLGVIDLDPASCEQAQKAVRTEIFYTIKQDEREFPDWLCRWTL